MGAPRQRAWGLVPPDRRARHAWRLKILGPRVIVELPGEGPSGWLMGTAKYSGALSRLCPSTNHALAQAIAQSPERSSS
jgi:hypothetical protein